MIQTEATFAKPRTANVKYASKDELKDALGISDKNDKRKSKNLFKS